MEPIILYNGCMQTKTGIHYHIKVGPEMVTLYDMTEPMAGPYVDITIVDMDDAYYAMLKALDGHLDGYIDEDDEEELYEMLEYATRAVTMGETEAADLGVEHLCWEIELLVCNGCIPKGMN